MTGASGMSGAVRSGPEGRAAGHCVLSTARAEFPVAGPPVPFIADLPICGSVWGALQLPLPAVSLDLDVIPHGGHVFPGFREVGVPMVEMSCWSLGTGLWDSSGPLF